MANLPALSSPDDPLSLLEQFLRFPSVSTQPRHAADLQSCAGWLVGLLESRGFAARLVPTPGHPVVLARGPRRPDRPTVLFYGHYDVQPEDPVELWTSPPFAPVVREGRIFARGASDNKGQILAHVLGAAALLQETGDLPVNVLFLIEGEEEIGSPHLEAVLRELGGELACDVVVVSDTGMVAHGWPTLTCSLRGIVALEVILHGPSCDLHSGIFGGAVLNPATALVRLLATLHDAEGRVAVPGFYDQLAPPAAWEEEARAALPPMDEALRAQTGVPALWGEAGFTTAERLGARPTAEINGITAGYQGEGTKTVLPARASAKLTFRLVPAQTPAAILAAVLAHLHRHCPPEVRLECVPGHGGQPYLLDPNGVWGLAARRALEATFGRPAALLREGGSIPIVQTFREVLGVDTLLLALASPDCRAHAPDENFPLENLHAGLRLHRNLLHEIAAAASSAPPR